MYCAVSRDLGEIFFLKVFALNKRNCHYCKQSVPHSVNVRLWKVLFSEKLEIASYFYGSGCEAVVTTESLVGLGDEEARVGEMGRCGG